MSLILTIYFWMVVALTAMPLYVVVLISFYGRRAIGLNPDGQFEHRVACFWSQWIMALNPWIKINYHGLENLPPPAVPVVFVANHQSGMDILIIYLLCRQFRWIAKIELFSTPVIGHAMRIIGYVAVDRGSSDSYRRVMPDCAKVLRKGISMFFFPEGTRSQTEEVRLFKSGAFRLAMSEGKLVVPIALHGSGKIIRKGSFFIQPSKVTLEVLPALNSAEFTEPDAFAAATRSLIETAIKRGPPS